MNFQEFGDELIGLTAIQLTSMLTLQLVDLAPISGKAGASLLQQLRTNLQTVAIDRHYALTLTFFAYHKKCVIYSSVEAC